MAGRGGPKLKEYRQHITSVRHWLKEIEYEGLIITEVYCGAFGNCQVILPTINQIMLSVDDSEDKMKWLVINVAKLEEEQRHLLAEEEKKKAEMENVQRRKAMNDKDGEGGDGGSEQVSAPPPPVVEEDETAAKIKTAWDKITIPKLEKYSGYDHPRPLWLLMKDGQVVYELNSANPPKLAKMVTSILTNMPLTEKELAEMDFHPDPNKKKRKKKVSKKTPAELAAIAAKKKRLLKAQRPEVQRPAEFIVQARISNIHKPVDPSGSKHPLLVLYTKDAASDDFTYYGQCERIRGENNPVYHRSFSFMKADVENVLDGQVDVELKFVLYDSETDAVLPSALPPVLGDAYMSLKQLLGEGEGSAHEIKLKKHVPHPPEKKSGRKNKAAEEHKEEDEDGAGLLALFCKHRAPEGVVTNYDIHLSSKQLPVLTKDAVGVAVPQPAKVNPDGTEVDPAILAENSRRDYFIEFQLSDENSLRAASIGITENVKQEADPVFQTTFRAPHFTRDDRSLTFHLYDGWQVDERFFDGLTNGMGYKKELVATASIKFEAFLLLRKQFKNQISLPWLDANGMQLNDGLSTLNITADELNDDGSIDPFDPNEELIDPSEKLPEKLEVVLSLLGLERAADASISKAPLVAVFVKTLTGSFEFLGQTERAKQNPQDGVLNVQFTKTFLFGAPKPATTPVSDEISADTSYAAFSSPTAASPAASPRPGANRTNIYKFVVYDAESDDLKAQGDPLGESTIELSKELLALGSSHSLTLVDKTSTPFPNTSLQLNLQEVGSVQPIDLIVSAGGLVKVASNPAALPNPLVKVYATHKTTGNQLVSAGETERIVASTDPSFLSKVQLEAYSAFASHIRIVVYDVPSEGVDGAPIELTEDHVIGEVNFPLSDFQTKSTLSEKHNAAGQPQPIEFKLVKIYKSENPEEPNRKEEVNGGLAVIRLVDITPKPPKKKQKKLDENGDEISDDEEDLEAAADLHAKALAAADASPRELTKEERELGTSPAMTDGSKIAVSVSALDIPKKDFTNDKYPFIALFKKTPALGQYEYLDQTECVRDEDSPVWQKTFLLDNPQGSQFYKILLLDTPRVLSPAEAAVWAQASSLALHVDKYEALTKQGGDAELLGEAVIDVQKLLIRAEPQRFTDRFGAEVPKCVLKVQAQEIGNINSLQLHLSASNLPKSELFNKTDPLVVLSARNPNTGALNELNRTERLVNATNAEWATALAVDGYSKADRELRLAVYDSDADPKQSVSDKDLLGEVSTSLNALLNGSVELKLQKGGKPVTLNDTASTLKVRAAARGSAKSRPGSAVKQPSLSRPVSAQQKLEANLAAKDAAAQEAMYATEATSSSSAAPVAEAVASPVESQPAESSPEPSAEPVATPADAEPAPVDAVAPAAAPAESPADAEQQPAVPSEVVPADAPPAEAAPAAEA